VERLLEELKARYDYIIIDSAPVLATDDAGAWDPDSEYYGRATLHFGADIREALDRLHKRKVKVLGSCLQSGVQIVGLLLPVPS
jgi:hypothetical protein